MPWDGGWPTNSTAPTPRTAAWRRCRAKAHWRRCASTPARSCTSCFSPRLAAITALRFFFEVALGRGELMAKMSHVRVPRKLPVVLSPEEVERLLDAAPGLKHKAALSVAYGAGQSRCREKAD